MRKTIKIDGMTCNNCVKHVKDALGEEINGLHVVAISLEDKCAIVEVPEDVSYDSIKEVISDLGYTVTSIE